MVDMGDDAEIADLIERRGHGCVSIFRRVARPIAGWGANAKGEVAGGSLPN
jgi:hypothetical protein